MRTVLAVLLALVLFVASWALLALVLGGLFYLGNQTGQSHPLVSLINVLLMWFVSPGFGAFVATFATPTIVKGSDASSVHASFVTIVVCITLIVTAGHYTILAAAESDVPRAAMGFGQVIAMILGARLGNRLHMVSK